MKIIHVGVFNQMKNGDTFYSSTYKMHNGFARNGHYIYPFSYRDIARCSGIFKSKKWGNKSMNKKLIETCATIQPELLLLGHAESVTIDTLKAIKNRVPKIKIAMWFVDALWNERNIININSKLPMLDALFVTTGGGLLKQFKTKNNKVAFFPNMTDDSMDIYRNFESINLPIDFIFCGTDKGDQFRREFVYDISTKLQSLRTSFPGSINNPSIYGSDYLTKLSQCKMGLNYSRQNNVYLCSSNRIAQLTGNGILTFTPRIPGFETLYSDDEVVYFDTIDELIGKINYYHNHPKEADEIAKRGWEKAQTLYSSSRVTQFMIETIFDIPYSQHYGYENEVIQDL